MKPRMRPTSLPHGVSDTALRNSMARLHPLLLLLTAGLTLAVLLMPQSGLGILRTELPWLGSTVGWLEAVSPRLDLDHLIAFAMVASSARLALPRVPTWQVMLALGLFAGITELAQHWVPGRMPSMADAALDLAGALVGYSFAAIGAKVRPARP
jgi:hypothetical protein